MTRRFRLALFVVAAALAGCAAEKQWMKVGEPYTTAEFRRDYADCSKTKDGTLDDECMRAKGWVDMKPSKGDRAADTPPPAQVSPKYQNRTPAVK
jgi:hypothetical protein